MKNTPLFIKISLILCLFAFVMTIGDFLALHDIWNDYVSRKVIEACDENSALNLPKWSETKSEWQMVNISWLVRILYLAFSSVTLYMCLKALKKKDL